MTARKRNWIIGIGLFVVVAVAGLAIAASIAASRIEPYAREQAIRYLSQRFASDVELQRAACPAAKTSPLRLLLTRGRGISARIEGEGLSMQLKSRPAAAPLFTIQTFHCEVAVDSLLHPPVYRLRGLRGRNGDSNSPAQRAPATRIAGRRGSGRRNRRADAIQPRRNDRESQHSECGVDAAAQGSSQVSATVRNSKSAVAVGEAVARP